MSEEVELIIERLTAHSLPVRLNVATQLAAGMMAGAMERGWDAHTVAWRALSVADALIEEAGE